MTGNAERVSAGICIYPNLREELLASGLSPKSRTYTPAQVGLIVGALGEPGEN
ncbi:DUF4248 domain-containing protein [Bacteroides stercoris]|uniref:DUF4248 domain-containing protein n=1 Tax=Bacteroides stercoris TaxID=46506 RepID=A0A7J5L7U3_BACSE|nr:DUF4248 domain-containing protein [Bacteroides stercoris]KAB5290399.1 DUF4248 domain-containing protein [Bacteroides stercoris]KAB5291270.1 DUF4248 domain-containing protein [Bacteroides stercoris]KAB5296131.1 DUF4248 domain-containing protein [Bacteroides stercoris]KAB5300202.1 DUF4248 domain-containing protein [Bacteroides stercoris]